MAHVVSYSHITTATIPQAAWDETYFTLSTWKGYLQSFPGFMGLRMAARAMDNGDVRLHTATIWEYPEHLEEWRGSEWSVEHLLTSLRQPAFDIKEETFEDFC